MTTKQPAKAARKMPSTTNGLLRRLIEQGDERYSMMGRTLYMLSEIRKELKNMASEVVNKVNAKLDAVQETLQGEAEEIRAAIEAAGAGDATPEEVTALETRLDGLNAAIEALVAAPAPPEEPPTE